MADSMRKIILIISGVLICVSSQFQAKNRFFLGGLGGISTLSADGRSLTNQNSSQVSLYKPENGPALNLYAGIDLSDYFSLQGNYVWNRNDFVITSTQAVENSVSFYEQLRGSQQHSAVGDALLYFRGQQSWARPYLSAGIGFVNFKSDEGTLLALRGSPRLPPAEFTSSSPVLRVAVGIDFSLSSK